MRGRDVPLGIPEFVEQLNFQFEINQTSKIVSQMRIYIDEYVVQFSEITKE